MKDGARRLLVSTLYNNNININARTQHAAHYQNIYIDTGTVDDDMAQCIKQKNKKEGRFIRRRRRMKRDQGRKINKTNVGRPSNNLSQNWR